MGPDHRLTESNRLALLMHESVDRPFGKMGFGLMRYGVAPTVVVIDRANAGRDLATLTGIPCHAPIVASVREALEYGPDTLVPAIAPAGGILPEDWLPEVREALAAGLSLVNGLHRPMASDPGFASLVQPGRYIWDVRREPEGLANGTGLARDIAARRVLLVGTDMACGKMTAALELDHEARARGLRSRFVATGQIGIVISGAGLALDAVRIDFATGAVEDEVLRAAEGQEFVFIEGQGSLLHPASTATLALMRGAMPTHLVLVHRAGQEAIWRCPWVPIPPLADVIRLYELVASASPGFPPARVAAIVLNTGHLEPAEARDAIEAVGEETALPVTDVVRYGAGPILEALLSA